MNSKIVLIILFYLPALFSCKNLKEKNFDSNQAKNSYWLYAPVIELVNKNDESISYAFTDSVFNKHEVKVLISVLERKGYKYKITLDSQVMISKISAPNIEALYSIRGEMKKILRDTSQTWYWQKSNHGR